MYDNTQVPRMIADALANGQNQTKPNGDDLMMNNMNNQAMNEEMNTQQPLQRIPVQFSVYDPNTGRNWNEDAQGKRVSRMALISGVQLTNINSRFDQFSNFIARYQGEEKSRIPYLTSHNVKMMSVDSASVIIDLLAFINSQVQMMEQKWKENWDMKFSEMEHQVAVLTEQLDSALKDPKVAAEIHKMRQAEDAKRDAKN